MNQSSEHSQHRSLKEAAVERMIADMQRAQEMATMGSWTLDVASGEVSWTRSCIGFSVRIPTAQRHQSKSSNHGIPQHPGTP